MPDYAKTIIYQIECKDPNITKTYGGHSTNLIKRRQAHKKSCNNPNSKAHNRYVYQFIRANGGWENWQVVWQYDYPCATKREAELEETKFIKENNCELNSVMPAVSEEEKKIKKAEINAKPEAIARRIEYRANETPQQKAKRLRRNKERRVKKIAEETEEEKKERLRKQRESGAKFRAKKKAEKEAQKNLMGNAPLTII